MGPSVCGEEEGSKNRSLRNPSDRWCSVDTSPPQATLKDLPLRFRDYIERFKPAKWNPCDAQWWEGGQEYLMVNSAKSSRIDLAEWELMIWNQLLQFAGLQWQSSAVSAECPRLNSDWLASSRLCFDRNEDNWLKTTRSSIFSMNGRREAGL